MGVGVAVGVTVGVGTLVTLGVGMVMTVGEWGVSAVEVVVASMGMREVFVLWWSCLKGLKVESERNSLLW